MIGIVLVLIVVLPIGMYFWHEHKISTPALQWPFLAKLLNMTYEASPPRLSGDWAGRRVAIETSAEGVTATAWLGTATRLRVECGPADLVTKRSGLIVPDRVEPLDKAFRDKLLARCSDKAAGPVVFDATLQQRLAAMPSVDFIGQDTRVVWTLPALKDIDSAEALLGALCAVADGVESFPQEGAMPRA